jgi:heat shock protein 1/8
LYIGNTHLGGTDFDNKLVSYCIELFKHQTGTDITKIPFDLEQSSSEQDRDRYSQLKKKSERARRLLRTACEEVKVALSSRALTKIAVDHLYDDMDFTATISQATFESMIHRITISSVQCRM